jgi:uncharacterized protein (UPF0333 family)
MIRYSINAIQLIVLSTFLFSFMVLDDKIIMYSYINDSKETGYITLKNEQDKICEIEVSITDIDSVESLNTQRYSYVVWIENQNGTIFNIGNMKGISGRQTYYLSANINAFCITKPVRIFVTEELNENASIPSSLMIASTKKF